jgi:hypothetical protein
LCRPQGFIISSYFETDTDHILYCCAACCVPQGFIISSYFALRAMYTYGATRQAIIDAEARLTATGQMFARGQSGPLSAEELDAARGVREALLSADGGEEQYPVPAGGDSSAA